MELEEIIQRSKARPEIYAPALAMEALRLRAERDRLRAELAELRNPALPDCRTCKRHYVSANGEHKCGSVLFCRDGDAYDAYKPVRLYQEEGDDGNA